jgi:hypothetical protein
MKKEAERKECMPPLSVGCKTRRKQDCQNYQYMALFVYQLVETGGFLGACWDGSKKLYV